MKDRKQVTTKGITWTVLSTNERVCLVSGRHFFAVRCNPMQMWSIVEMDGDLFSGPRRQIGYLPHRLGTEHLSLAVLDIVGNGEKLPTDEQGNTPLNKLTHPATIDYLRHIGAKLITCPSCSHEAPRHRGVSVCVNCMLAFGGSQ